MSEWAESWLTRCCCCCAGLPEIESGLKELRVIKTTQSSFEHFIHDEFATLPDTPDRVFSTIVYSKWHYGSTTGVDFDKAW
jgi:urate oxidase